MYRNEDIMSLTAIDNLYYKIILKIKNFKSKNTMKVYLKKKYLKKTLFFLHP